MTADDNPFCAGIVLCGGRSRRMGTPKAWLPFGPERLLQRMVRIVKEAVRDVIVVAAPGQELPSLANDVVVVHDRSEGRGPLEGLAVGLAALPECAEAVFVTSCDAPLLRGAFVRRMIELHQAAQSGGDRGIPRVTLPFSDGLHHPLAAVYDRWVLPHVELLLAAGRLRTRDLLESLAVRIVEATELREVDPGLASLRNLNRPEEYQAALADVVEGRG